MIYDPAEDSFLLQKHVRKLAQGKVLDMGTGSGILAEAALEKTQDVLAVDTNPEAVDQVRKKGIPAVMSDLFENIKEKFDFIIFNPPYLPEDENEDEESREATTGGSEGYEILERFLQQAKGHMKQDGKILLVVSSLTGDVENLFTAFHYTFELLEQQAFFFEQLKVYLLRPRNFSGSR